MKIIEPVNRATQLEHLAQAQQLAPSVNTATMMWRERLDSQQVLGSSSSWD